MAVKKKKRNKRKPTPLDDKDHQVAQSLAINPRSTIRKIAEQLGMPPTTVWRRIKKIQDPDRITEFTGKIDEVIPLAFAVLVRRLLSGDYSAARDVFYGRGILSNKHKHDHNHKGHLTHQHEGDPDLSGIDTEKLRVLVEEMRNGVGEKGYTPPVVGEEVSPDGSERSD